MLRFARRFSGSLIVCILVGLFPLFVLWKNNLGQTPTSAVYLPLLYTFLLTLILFAAWLVISRSPEKAALLTCLSAVFLFSFGHAYNLVEGRLIAGQSVGYAKMFALWFILFATACFLLLRARHTPSLWLLTLPVGVLILCNALSIGSFLVKIRQSTAKPVSGVAASEGAQDLPDIYYIVLDAYARNDIIYEVTGYDNSDFTEGLKERGFSLPECAFSNYDSTALTLASVLNYDTLDNLQDHKTDLILDNKVSKTFRSYGYQFVTGAGFAPFNDIQTSDLYLNYARDKGAREDVAHQKFATLYLDTTVFRLLSEMSKNNPEMFSRLPFWQLINRADNDMLEYSRFFYQQNNYMFESLAQIPEKPGNYFVYAQIIAPHGPYTYNADCSMHNPWDEQDERVLYKNAITCVNRRALELVDALLEKSNPAPIIILQGDHGMHTLTNGLDKHKILSAYYLPGEISTPPYETITPVNNFRLILRNYFDPTMELLPDTMFVKFTNTFEPLPISCDMQPW